MKPPKHTPHRPIWSLLTLFFLVLFSGTASLAEEWVVSSFEELTQSLHTASPRDTILLEDGIYSISGTWAAAVTTDHLTIQSLSGNRESVIIQGWGMYDDFHHGFWISADHVTIRDLTIQSVRNHCIQTDVDVNNLSVINCILKDAGEQILKVPASDGADHSDNGLVEGCLFEYSAGVGPRYYIGGIDVHRGRDWVVRKNIFRFIRSPDASIAEHAVHFWNDSRNTLVEQNLIITCDRGIGFGLGISSHTGGIIRNNMIYHDGSLISGMPGQDDVGISLETSPDTHVYNNTIFFDSSYPNAVEYRFAATSGLLIANNLTNRRIMERNSATAILQTNVTEASGDWFKDAASGNLHLAYDVQQVIDQGSALAGIVDDFDEEARPQGGGIEIGADEISGCAADLDEDTDVDGRDLFLFTSGSPLSCLEFFSTVFGTFF